MAFVPRGSLRHASLCAAALLLLAPLASADPSKEELKRARAQFQEATELEKAGDYVRAEQMFREVGQVRMSPQVRYHIARCQELQGKLVAALGGYKLARDDAAAMDPSFTEEVDAAISKLEAAIPKLQIQRGAGAEAAIIELDGATLGASAVGAAVPVDPGPHSVRAKASGYRTFSKNVELQTEQSLTVTIELEPETSAEPAKTEERPAETAAPVAPTHRVAAHPTLGWVSLGVGGVGLIAGGTFFYLRSSKIDDAKSLCGSDGTCDGDPQSVRSKASKALDKAQSYESMGWAGLGLGAVGLGAAAYFFFVDTQDAPLDSPDSAWLPVAPGADAGGLSYFARF